MSYSGRKHEKTNISFLIFGYPHFERNIVSFSVMLRNILLDILQSKISSYDGKPLALWIYLFSRKWFYWFTQLKLPCLSCAFICLLCPHSRKILEKQKPGILIILWAAMGDWGCQLPSSCLYWACLSHFPKEYEASLALRQAPSNLWPCDWREWGGVPHQPVDDPVSSRKMALLLWFAPRRPVFVNCFRSVWLFPGPALSISLDFCCCLACLPSPRSG